MKNAERSRPMLSRGERGVAERVWQAPLTRSGPVAWDRTAITLQHQLKAGAVTLYCVRRLQLLGCPRDALDYYWPALVHLEALVYVADLAVEREQESGVPAGTAWLAGIEEFLHAYDIRDARISDNLRTLKEYARWECEAARYRHAYDVQDMLWAGYSRAADVRLVTRFSRILAGIAEGVSLAALESHMHALGEWVRDIRTYQEDVAEDSFNFYRMCVWSVGREAAAARVREVAERLRGDLRRDLGRADRRSLVQFAQLSLPRPRALRRLAVKRRPTPVFAVLPRPLLLAYLRWRLNRTQALRLPQLPEAVDEAEAEPPACPAAAVAP